MDDDGEVGMGLAKAGLVVDNRGVISKDLRDLIKLAAKSAAKKNWEVCGIGAWD